MLIYNAHFVQILLFLWCKIDPVWLTSNCFGIFLCLDVTMLTTRSLLADIEAVLVFWLFAVFQWMCWSTIISKGQTEKLVFSIPILIILQAYFRRWNVTNFLNPCLCGRQRGQDKLCRFQLLLSPLWVFFCQWFHSFPIRVFLSLGWVCGHQDSDLLGGYDSSSEGLVALGTSLVDIRNKLWCSAVHELWHSLSTQLLLHR